MIHEGVLGIWVRFLSSLIQTLVVFYRAIFHYFSFDSAGFHDCKSLGVSSLSWAAHGKVAILSTVLAETQADEMGEFVFAELPGLFVELHWDGFAGGSRWWARASGWVLDVVEALGGVAAVITP